MISVESVPCMLGRLIVESVPCMLGRLIGCAKSSCDVYKYPGRGVPPCRRAISGAFEKGHCRVQHFDPQRIFFTRNPPECAQSSPPPSSSPPPYLRHTSPPSEIKSESASRHSHQSAHPCCRSCTAHKAGSKVSVQAGTTVHHTLV